MKVYFTFGQDHRHEISGMVFDKDCVVEIEKTTVQEAREKMFKLFGDKWSFMYMDLESVRMEYYIRGIIKLVDGDNGKQIKGKEVMTVVYDDEIKK